VAVSGAGVVGPGEGTTYKGLRAVFAPDGIELVVLSEALDRLKAAFSLSLYPGSVSSSQENWLESSERSSEERAAGASVAA